jgi:hypothetical protein
MVGDFSGGDGILYAGTFTKGTETFENSRALTIGFIALGFSPKLFLNIVEIVLDGTVVAVVTNGVHVKLANELQLNVGLYGSIGG